MSLSQSFSDIFVPACRIKVDGVPLDVGEIMSVRVNLLQDPPASFSVTLNDPELKLIDPITGLCTEGRRVEISLGYVDHTSKIFVGEITAVEAEFPTDGPVTVTLSGFDLMHRLTRGNIYRVFEGSQPGTADRDSDVVSRVAAEVGLRTDVDQTPERKTPWVQAYESNQRFLDRIADANNFYLWVDGDTLYFKQEARRPEAIALVWGQTLLSFSAAVNTAAQLGAVEARGWDPAQKQPVSARARAAVGLQARMSAPGRTQVGRGAGGSSQRILAGEYSVSSTEEAQSLAARIMRQHDQDLITGSGSAVGDPKIRPGAKLSLKGLGRFSGAYVVTSATHLMNVGGYQTTFEVTH